MFVVYKSDTQRNRDFFRVVENADEAIELFEGFSKEPSTETAGWGPIIGSTDGPHEMVYRQPGLIAAFTNILLEKDPEFDLRDGEMFTELLDGIMPVILEMSMTEGGSIQEAADALWPYVYDPERLAPSKRFPVDTESRRKIFAALTEILDAFE